MMKNEWPLLPSGSYVNRRKTNMKKPIVIMVFFLLFINGINISLSDDITIITINNDSIKSAYLSLENG